MKMESKFDLMWIIPYLLGSIGIIISAVVFLKVVAIETIQYDLWLGIFQLGVVLCVLDKGLMYLADSLKEFTKLKSEIKDKK